MLWTDYLKHPNHPHSSFLEWTADELSSIRAKYKDLDPSDTKSIARLQGEELFLDKLRGKFIMADREARQQEEYRRSIGQQ